MSAIEARLAAVEARLAALEARAAGGGSSGGDAGIASDRELDGEYGDEIVKKDPKRWLDQGGDSFAGCRMSQCPSDYLHMLASLFDWMADQDEKKGKTYTNKRGEEVPVAPLNRRKAAKARGWAKRNQGKAQAPRAAEQTSLVSVDEEIPF